MTSGLLFCFGLGYTGMAVARRFGAGGWRVAGTCRTAEKAARLSEAGIEAHVFTGNEAMAGAGEALAGTTHLLASIAPGEGGDPALVHHGADIEALAGTLERIVYLSTTAVYGDHGGAWIDEETALDPASARAWLRVEAERAWTALGDRIGIPVDILRLSGIYGPGRSQIGRLERGTAKRIVKPGQVFNRIHIDDIVQVVERVVAAGLVGAVYNVADDEPAPPQDAIVHAARLLGIEPPPAVAFEDADMTEMERSFYSEAKRVANDRIKQRLGVVLFYPTYREGLAAIARERRGGG